MAYEDITSSSMRLTLVLLLVGFACFFSGLFDQPTPVSKETLEGLTFAYLQYQGPFTHIPTILNTVTSRLGTYGSSIEAAMFFDNPEDPKIGWNNVRWAAGALIQPHEKQKALNSDLLVITLPSISVIKTRIAHRSPFSVMFSPHKAYPLLASYVEENNLGVVGPAIEIYGDDYLDYMFCAGEGCGVLKWKEEGEVHHPVVDPLMEKVEPVQGVVMEKVVEVKEKIGEMTEKGGEKMEEMKEKAEEKIGEMKEKGGEKMEEMKEKAKDKFGEIKEKGGKKVEEMKEMAKEEIEEMKEKAEEKIGEMKEKGGAKVEEVKEKIVELKDKSGEAVRDGLEGFKEGAEKTVEGVKKKMEEGEEKVEEMKEKTKEKIGEMKEKGEGKVEEVKEEGKHLMEEIRKKAKFVPEKITETAERIVVDVRDLDARYRKMIHDLIQEKGWKMVDGSDHTYEIPKSEMTDA